MEAAISEDAVHLQKRRKYDNDANKRYRQRQKLLLHYKTMFNNHALISYLYKAHHLLIKHLDDDTVVGIVTRVGQQYLTQERIAQHMRHQFYQQQWSLYNGLPYTYSNHHALVIGGSPTPTIIHSDPSGAEDELSIPIESSKINHPDVVSSQPSVNVNDNNIDTMSLPPIIDEDQFEQGKMKEDQSDMLDIMRRSGMKSRLIKRWAFQPGRERVVIAMVAIIVDLYSNALNSDKGGSVSIDAPFGENANTPTPNCNARKVMRNYYGRVINLAGWMYCYGTATGAYTVGIPPNQFVNRPFNEHMDTISKYILHTMIHHPAYRNEDSVVKKLPNHMTHLSFYHKREDKEGDKQLSYHNDCIWGGDDNKWLASKNTQQMNTPTYSVTVGHSRIPKMRKYVPGIGFVGPVYEIILEHGDLFILDPRDEMMMIRGDDLMSKWKHGDINVKREDGLSIGLIFRTVTAKQQFDPVSGKFVVTPEFWDGLSLEKRSEYERRDEILDNVEASGGLKESYDHMRGLFDRMYAEFFKS